MTDVWNGAELGVSGILKSMDKDWVVVTLYPLPTQGENKTVREMWVPMEVVLSIEVNYPG